MHLRPIFGCDIISPHKYKTNLSRSPSSAVLTELCASEPLLDRAEPVQSAKSVQGSLCDQSLPVATRAPEKANCLDHRIR